MTRALVRAKIMPARQDPVTAEVYDARLDEAGPYGGAAGALHEAVERLMYEVMSLSRLTAPLAVDYLDRLSRPLPGLTPEMGVQIVGRSYVAHMAVESDPGEYLADDVPVIGTLPEPRDGYAPRDLLNRVVKASRRSFEAICAVPPEVWDCFVAGLTMKAHEMQLAARTIEDSDADDNRPSVHDELLPVAAIDGLARFGWVLRQVDLHYGGEPERRDSASHPRTQRP
jgi:hypothetical protein